MNTIHTTRHLVTVAALALVAGGSAFAQEATPDTWMKIAGQADRQAVHAEAVAAVQAGQTSYGHRQVFRFTRLSQDSALTRAQVRAEAVEAMRLGLTGHGELTAPRATPAQSAAIRQAGLRAVADQVAKAR